tara:strand:+ start:63 stop:1379 length:1317 start_codon:yes stop_codon:yes gene_type:complete
MAFDNFKGKKFTEVSASTGTTKKPPYKKIPSVLRKGKKSTSQGGFFNYDLIKTAIANDPNSVHVEQDPTTGEVATYFTASVFRTMMDNHISNSFSSGAYAQLSASFFSKFGNAVDNIPAGELGPCVLSRTFEAGSTGSGTGIMPACTASFRFKLHPGVSNPSKLIIVNESTNALYSTFKFGSTSGSLNDSQKLTSDIISSSIGSRSFDGNSFHYIQDDFEPEFAIEYNESVIVNEAGVVFFALTSSFTSSEDVGVLSGSALATTGAAAFAGPFNYNGININDGFYKIGDVKGFISGEGDFGPGETNAADAFFPNQQFIFYTSSAVVRSGSYLYASESQGAAVASSSGTATTLYYISSSGGPSESFTGSFCGDQTKETSGSHLWLDATLRTAASAGFYAIPGTGTVLGGFIGGITASANYEGTTTTRETVPRFTSKSVH